MLSKLAHLCNGGRIIVQVHEQINAGIGKDRHTGIVILCCPDVVYTDSICSELFHERGVHGTLSAVDQRIGIRSRGDELICDAWRNDVMSVSLQNDKWRRMHTFDEELVAITSIEFGAWSN